MELNMICKDCNTVNFAVPYAEKETRKCHLCGGELKEITVDFKEDDPGAEETEEGKIPPEYVAALWMAVQKGVCTISLIQRKLNMGYNRAGKILDWMEEKGYLAPFDGMKPRTVLLTKEDFEKEYGKQDE